MCLARELSEFELYDLLKQFISSQIKQAEERGADNGWDDGIKFERERIVKLIKEKGLHLGYKNNIITLINQNNE